MNTTSKIVLGMTFAIITVPGLAAGTMSNSKVWTTTNGSAVVDSSGNAVRTIHYLEKTVAVTKETHKTTPSLIAAIKKAVAKVLNKEPDIVPEPAAQIVLIADPTPVIVEQELVPDPVKEAAVAVVEDEPETVEEVVVVVEDEPEPVEEVVVVVEEELEVVVEAPVVVTPMEPVKVEYSFNDYLATILFDTNSATLTAEGEGSLKQLAMATARAERVLSVQLFGYADSRGDHDYNMALSAKRMRSVEEFLSGQSLNVTSRFAKGESSPVLGADGEDLALSRRVDVAIKTRHLKD
jgi:outer membrane protein OmpA-like peptidoglycan-associated protein